jgi:hypothetical protein
LAIAYLQAFGRFVDSDPDRDLLVEHQGVREELAHADACIHQQPVRSVLVVGEPRSGKTAFVQMLARRAEASGWTVFEAGAAQLQSGQMYIGQLEERLARLATDLAVEKRVLWHVPDFLHLATSGTHKGQSATMLDQVLPAIASGRLVLLGEITPDALTKVLHALARHYLGTGQMPGVVLDLLKLAMGRAVARNSPHLHRDEVLATMSQLTGMPQRVLDDRERDDLSALRAYLSARVIGQDEAVEAVVDRIAMFMAGLTDPSRPVGVFLFAGPTGTGKTEAARRGMHATEVSGTPRERPLLVISGFGCARILAAEVGLHVLDYETGDESGRTLARVLMTPTPDTAPGAADEYATLTRELERTPAASVVVRRYRLDASPLIRDVRAGWRTGRADLVFEGNFDVMRDVLLPSEESV